MKNSSSKIFFVLFLILAGAYLVYVKNSSQSNQFSQPQQISPPVNQPEVDQWAPTKVPPQTISITAKNGTFTPNLLQLVQHQDAILKVDAIDQDYVFELKEFDISSSAPKGKVTEIIVPGKALGTYIFSCGQGCTGKVNVVDNDEDEEHE